MSPASNRRPNLPQFSLGLFIIWQLFFLAASNLLNLLPHTETADDELSDSRGLPANAIKPVPGKPAINFILGLTGGWAELTGQSQAWWLFAPDFPRQATFPVVELRWDDDKPVPAAPKSVRLHSVLEPEDPRNYFRPPGAMDRLFHYEVRLGLIFTAWNPESVQEFPDDWRAAVAERVYRQRRSIHAYLRWRVRRFLAEHPKLPPPRQAVLSIRVYPTTPAGSRQDRQTAWEQPLARWTPARKIDGDGPSLEVCDPVSGIYFGVAAKVGGAP
jgi:hypothetical protein